MEPSPQHPGALNWLLLLSLGVIWGTAFMSVSVALEGFGPITVAALRTGLGVPVLLVGGALVGQGIARLNEPRQWLFAGLIGAGALALPFLLLSWGQQHIPSAFAGVAMGAVPLLILPLAYVFSPEEGIGPKRVIGVGLGFVGLLVLIGPGAVTPARSELAVTGQIACIGAAACYAVGSILTRRAPKMPPIAFAAATMIVAAAILVPLALVVEGVPNAAPARPTTAVVYAAIFPTALAAFLRVRVITTAGSVFMSLVSYMVPVWSVVFGAVLLREDLPPQLFLALALILAGILLSQWRSLKGAFRISA